MGSSIKHPHTKVPSYGRYHGEGHRLRNKLRRILKNNGVKAAEAYEKSYKTDPPNKANPEYIPGLGPKVKVTTKVKKGR